MHENAQKLEWKTCIKIYFWYTQGCSRVRIAHLNNAFLGNFFKYMVAYLTHIWAQNVQKMHFCKKLWESMG